MLIWLWCFQVTEKNPKNEYVEHDLLLKPVTCSLYYTIPKALTPNLHYSAQDKSWSLPFQTNFSLWPIIGWPHFVYIFIEAIKDGVNNFKNGQPILKPYIVLCIISLWLTWYQFDNVQPIVWVVIYLVKGLIECIYVYTHLPGLLTTEIFVYRMHVPFHPPSVGLFGFCRKFSCTWHTYHTCLHVSKQKLKQL